MRYAIILALLLFEPIIIDEPTFNEIRQSAHSNMRGTEYDILMSMMKELEQRAVQKNFMERHGVKVNPPADDGIDSK